MRRLVWRSVWRQQWGEVVGDGAGDENCRSGRSLEVMGRENSESASNFWSIMIVGWFCNGSVTVL